MLAIAASRASDAPLVLVVDTSFGRQTRVQRDDGPILGELAAATEQVNAFVALALDDDIAGADGANIALAKSFSDRLFRPRHLYRVADLHLFHKDAHGRAALPDIYTFLRNSVPGFNWTSALAAIYRCIFGCGRSSRRASLCADLRLPAFRRHRCARATNRPALSLIGLMKSSTAPSMNCESGD